MHAPKREKMLSFLSPTQIVLITCGVPTDILLPKIYLAESDHLLAHSACISTEGVRWW